MKFDLRYPGQVLDEETGLNYNLNRSYGPPSGRYFQADPIGLDGGWNRFGYVGGDPLNAIDPQGLNAVVIANRAAAWVQGAYYRYGPAITEFIAGASGVNGAVVSPMNPLVAQIPTTVSRMTPVARAVAEGIESGGFCAANDVVAAARYFEGTRYSERVLGQIKSGDFHGFTRSVEAFAQYGKVSVVTQPSTGLSKEMLNITGSYRGVQGTFEFIKHESGVIYHRLFRPD
ncbi:hypothetical protein AVME950_23855 [Acidovorax sp. SUPP950]|uniref:RHS repeat-associated core domain-containing protein n=1 Tax=Acidovorax sp. SUPP950 TaxID=511901 RepID=UPI0023C390F6|nr:RHS repeat-associated core domain-containing protein [Acidovorax sp. SUPP950]GKS77989.1 hypothetical protein AVME950_23855 [Acidovorax sp. SUPP950]